MLVAVHGADPRFAAALDSYVTTTSGRADMRGSKMVVLVARSSGGTFYVQLVDITDFHRTGDIAADAVALVKHLLFKASQHVPLPWRNTRGFRCGPVLHHRDRRLVPL